MACSSAYSDSSAFIPRCGSGEGLRSVARTLRSRGRRSRSTNMYADHTTARYVQRFDVFDRALHGALMISFLGLSVTGLPLLFSQSAWAVWEANALGGPHTIGIIHRLSAMLLIGVFLVHLTRVLGRVIVHGDRSVLWGPTSMVPQPRDATDLF